ncbi:MAG: ribbon-helix-helix protein, CopG family [Terriglobales bacterium]
MAVKVTFTLDDETIARLNLAARRTQKPKSQVVREAIQMYQPPAGKVGEAERRRRVKIFDEYIARRPTRPASDVDDELRELREVRRLPGRLHPND